MPSLFGDFDTSLCQILDQASQPLSIGDIRDILETRTRETVSIGRVIASVYQLQKEGAVDMTTRLSASRFITEVFNLTQKGKLRVTNPPEPKHENNPPVRSYYLHSPTGNVVILREYTNCVYTEYPDKTNCVFAPPLVPTTFHPEGFNNDGPKEIDPAYLSAVKEMGYSDPMRYAVEHEISHHLVAFARGHAHSRIVWNQCHGIPQSMEQPESSLEEHLVNHLQKFVSYGTTDSYGQLIENFGATGLAALGRKLLSTARPWLNA